MTLRLYSASALFALLPAAAAAHVGHVGSENIGHSHWLGWALSGLALGMLGLLTAAAVKRVLHARSQHA